MARVLMGVETEYAAAGPPLRTDHLQRMLRIGHELLDCVSGGCTSDLFLGNGSRVYLDCLEHPEVATPECGNPADVVRYIAAGESLMESLCELHRTRHQDSNAISLFKTNVDYSGARTTWGCHESYLSRRAPADFIPHLVPHLVSRIVYTGAGGFNPLLPGLAPVLSPRVFHLLGVVTNASTDRRGIFHTKDETLSQAGYHRIHLICGESLCSHLATYLKCGTTALIIALIDNGGTPATGVQLTDPLPAMRQFADDTSCRVTAPVKGGRQLSAVDIQRHYLDAVQANLGAPWMPAWAGDVLREWGAMLDRLQRGPEEVQTSLDWAIKLALFRNHAANQGLSWSSLPFLSEVARAAVSRAALEEATADPLSDAPATGPMPESLTGPVRDALQRRLRDRGLGWADFENFLRVRAELFEIDLLFGRVGAKSLFAELDAAGVLEHAAPGVERLEEALHTPPTDTRAHARGAAIRGAARRDGLRCNWNLIEDLTGRRILKFDDPFATSAEWEQLPPARTDPRRGPELIRILEELRGTPGNPFADPSRWGGREDRP